MIFEAIVKKCLRLFQPYGLPAMFDLCEHRQNNNLKDKSYLTVDVCMALYK